MHRPLPDPVVWRAIRRLADGLYILRGLPPYAINVDLMGDVLVDAGSRHARGRILRELKGRTVVTHALTHAHADHQGTSHSVCEALGLALWCGEGDADAVEDGRIRERTPPHPINSLIGLAFPGPPHPVARRLRESDTVAGFTVLEVPGHSAGHIAFWRESDRTLICGDVITNMDTITGLPRLREPKSFFTPDPARNRESARRLAALEPELVRFGHGARCAIRASCGRSPPACGATEARFPGASWVASGPRAAGPKPGTDGTTQVWALPLALIHETAFRKRASQDGKGDFESE